MYFSERLPHGTQYKLRTRLEDEFFDRYECAFDGRQYGISQTKFN